MASLRYLPFLSPDGLEGGGVLGIFGNSRCCSLSILFLFRWRRWLKPTCSGQLILISRLSWSVNHLRMIGRIIACRFVWAIRYLVHRYVCLSPLFEPSNSYSFYRCAPSILCQSAWCSQSSVGTEMHRPYLHEWIQQSIFSCSCGVCYLYYYSVVP